MIVKEVLSVERPVHRFATVNSVNSAAGTASVTFPGEAVAFTVPTGAIRPTTGSTVRLGGKSGQFYVDQVISSTIGDLGIAGSSTLSLGTGAKIKFADDVKTDKIDLYGGAYTIGIGVFTLRYDAPTSAFHQFNVNSTEVMRVDGAGVDVVGAITATSSISGSSLSITNNAAAATFNGYSISAGDSPPSGAQIVRSHTNGYIYAGWINTVSGSTTSTIDRIYASYDGFIRYVTPATFRSQVIDGNYLSLSTTSSQQMLSRLVVAANVSGTTSTGALLLLGNNGAEINLFFNTGGTNKQIRTDDASSTFYFRTGDDAGWATVAAVISNQSSARYKENIVVESSGFVERAKRIELVSYDWKDGGSKAKGRNIQAETNGRCFGVIAEQVGSVDDELVFRNPKTGDAEGVDGLGLAALAIGALQELSDRLDRIEANLA